MKPKLKWNGENKHVSFNSLHFIFHQKDSIQRKFLGSNKNCLKIISTMNFSVCVIYINQHEIRLKRKDLYWYKKNDNAWKKCFDF